MLPRIIISQQSGVISVEVKPAKLEVKPDAIKMNMSGNAKVKVDITSSAPKIEIDQTEAFASAGLKKPIPLALDFYQKSYQKGMQEISTIAEEGLEFLRIENKGSPIPEQAMRINSEWPETRMTTIPSVGPDISLNEGNVNIQLDDQRVNIDWDRLEGKLSYVPYEVNITMERYPSIEITVEPGKELDLPATRGLGINLDQAV